MPGRLERAGHEQSWSPPGADLGELVVGVADHVLEVWVGQAGPQQQVGVEVGRVGVGLGGIIALGEPHHHVGGGALRADVGVGVLLATVELGQHLVGGVSAAGAVAHDLPAAAQVFWRIEEHPHVVAVAHAGGVEAEQPLHDHESPRRQVHRWPEGAVGVAVDGLENGLTGPQQAQMLVHNVHIVTSRIERSDQPARPLGAVVAVVIVEADVRHGVGSEHAHKPPRQRGFPAGRVTHHS